MTLNEIEKMFEYAGIEPVELDYPDNLDPIYPDFTFEKQLDIIKLISKQGQIIIENWEEKGFNLTFRANSNLRYVTMSCVTRKTVGEALARIIDDIWEDFTEEERRQIKEILR